MKDSHETNREIRIQKLVKSLCPEITKEEQLQATKRHSQYLEVGTRVQRRVIDSGNKDASDDALTGSGTEDTIDSEDDKL